MHSITIISATNRPDSNTEKVAAYYQSVLKGLGVAANILSLKNLPESVLHSDLYGKRSPEFQEIIEKYVEHQEKFIFITPEYNGSFAGILKVFLDAIPPRLWTDNKACLVGVSTGRAGNLRGMEHLTNILNYLKVNVYHNKLPISRVDTLMDGSGSFMDADTKLVIELQVAGFLKF
ncbi:MAG: putative flavoprotein [Bacteroidetes bacterium]|jgi:NAD(P)H-dependent FMN reductase|nr:putative flavoprotein [Bacteroidota bacterium]MDF2450838.1 putative flavoprotein [Bacteroidota bacterium]